MTTNASQQQFDYLVFIGRFEPFHRGHFAVVERALKLAQQVIILIGSANKPRTIRNPWTIAEREVMIRAAFEHDSDRLIIRPLRDRR
jgi:bifunctional NMN adenylyltransferase/nudix hydrolase